MTWQDVRKAFVGRLVAAIVGALLALLGVQGGVLPSAPEEVEQQPSGSK